MTALAVRPARFEAHPAAWWATVAFAAAAVALGAGVLADQDARPLLRYAAVAICVVAAIDDLRTRRLRNVFTAPALVLGVAGAPDLLSAAVAVLVAPLPFLVLAILQPAGMGIGDVKLAAVAGALVGLGALPEWWVGTALAGGLLAVIALIRHGRRGGTMAYGPALVLSLLWVLFVPLFA